jgi:small multidrug resistance family-3 protein
MLRPLIVLGFLILATSFETTGDALVRIGLYDKSGLARVGMIAAGGALLLGYGVFLNLAPLPFERVVGFYIATLFVMWQIVSFFTFRTLPSPPILVGGALIIAGGMIVSFWGTGSQAPE